MSYTLSLGKMDLVTFDTEDIIRRTRAKLQEKVGAFLANRSALIGVSDRLTIVARSPKPELREPVRIAKENLGLLNQAQDSLEVSAQKLLGTLGLIQSDLMKQPKATVFQKLFTTNVYGSRLPELVKDAANLGLRINRQNDEVKKLSSEISQLERAAKGQGILPSIGRIVSPLGVGLGRIGLGVGAVLGLAALIFLMPRRVAR